MSNTLSSSNPVLIVGAGPVGLAAATELTRHGVPFRLIDQNAAPSVHSKALGVQPRTLEIFAQMGLIEATLDAGHPIHGIRLHAPGQELAHIKMGGLDTPYPFTLILPQSLTEQVFIDHLAGVGVGVEREVELVSFTDALDGITATLRHADGTEETFQSPWLLGCDGAHSTVRHALGLAFEGGAYAESFVLADLKIAGGLPEDELSVFFHPDGLLAIFPLGRGAFRVTANLPPDAPAALLNAPTLEDIQALVQQRGLTDVTLSDSVWISGFRIHHRKVAHYRQGRAFVLGDAAHIHSPAGGQGMNTGIQDAHNLAWKLALVWRGQAPESLLDSYGAEREPVARGVLRLTDAMTRTVTLRQPLVEQLRNHVLPFLAGLETLQHNMANTITELAINYRKSPIVEQHWGHGLTALHPTGPAAGDRAPDGPIHSTPDNDHSPLWDILRGTGHNLLLFSGFDPTPDDYRSLIAIQATLQDYAPQLTPHLIVAGRSLSPDLAPSGSILWDNERALHQRYGADSACLYLIRPDGYIGYRSLPPEGAKLKTYWERIFVH